MALQQTAGLSFILQTGFLRNLLTQTAQTFRTAERTLNTERFNAARFNLNAALDRRIANATATSSVDQLIKSRLDIATESLNGVKSNLTNLASLAALAVAEADPVQRSVYQSQAEAIVQEIASSLSTAVSDDPNLINRVALSGDTIRSVRITSVDEDIESDGLTFTVALTETGTRELRNQALSTDSSGTAGIFDADTQILISGPNGSATVSIFSGESIGDAIAKVNAVSDATGVEAVVDADTDKADLRTIDATDEAFTISLVSGSSAEVSEGTSTGGVNAEGTITTEDGEVVTFEGTGRSINFTAGGVSGVIDLITDFTVLTEAATPTTTFTVHAGGQPILGADGTLLARQSIGAFDFSTLGVDEGGLDQIDLENDPSAALEIIAAAQDDVDTGITQLEYLSNSVFGERISSKADIIANAEVAKTDLDTFFEAIELFERIRAESQLNTSLALLSQLSTLFPITGLSSN